MTRAAVPEAAVDEHREPSGRKHKIRPARQRPLPPPARESVRTEQRRPSPFRRPVPAPTDPRHHFRALRLGPDVGLRHSLVG